MAAATGERYPGKGPMEVVREEGADVPPSVPPNNLFSTRDTRSSPSLAASPRPTERNIGKLTKSYTVLAAEEVGANTGTGEPMGLPKDWMRSPTVPTPPRKRENPVNHGVLHKNDGVSSGSGTSLSERGSEKSDRSEKDKGEKHGYEKPYERHIEKDERKKKKKLLMKEIEELSAQVAEMSSKIQGQNDELEKLQSRWWRDTGTDPNNERLSRILQASSACALASEGLVENLQTMIQSGADILLPLSDGRTALHCAASAGQAAVVSFLLDSGASLDAKDNRDSTPFSEACRLKQYSIVQLLDEARAFRQFKGIEKDYRLADYIPVGDESRKVQRHETVVLQRRLSKISHLLGSSQSERSLVDAQTQAAYDLQMQQARQMSPKTGRGAPSSIVVRSAPSNKQQQVTSSSTTAGAQPYPAASALSTPSAFARDRKDKEIHNRIIYSDQGAANAPTGAGSTPSPNTQNVPQPPPLPPTTSSGRGHGRHVSASIAQEQVLQLQPGEVPPPPDLAPPQTKQRKAAQRKSGWGFRRWLEWRPFRHAADEESTAAAGDSKAPLASPNSYGIAFGRLRGACQAPECHCTSFHADSTIPSVLVCTCKHFPASHEDLGESNILQSNILAGLEHLHITDEVSTELLIEKEVGTQWPKVLNPHLEDDAIARLFSDIVHNSDSIVDAHEIEFMKKLGQGASATVYLGTRNGVPVAIKVIDFFPSQKRPMEKIQYEMTEELRVMNALSHFSENVVQFYGVVTQPRLCILLEYCAHGSLTDVLSNRFLRLDWPLFFTWAKEIVMGVHDLHSWSPPIVHRDLKSLNLLVDSNYRIKVADFGLSRFLAPDEAQTTLGKMRGTYAYTDPEIYDGIKFSPKADMYSLGIIFWELIYRTLKGEYLRPYGEYPFMSRDFQIIVQVARKNLRPTIPATCPEPLAEVVQSLWTRVGDDRPTAADLLVTLDNIYETYMKNYEIWDALLPPMPQPDAASGNPEVIIVSPHLSRGSSDGNGPKLRELSTITSGPPSPRGTSTAPPTSTTTALPSGMSIPLLKIGQSTPSSGSSSQPSPGSSSPSSTTAISPPPYATGNSPRSTPTVTSTTSSAAGSSTGVVHLSPRSAPPPLLANVFKQHHSGSPLMGKASPPHSPRPAALARPGGSQVTFAVPHSDTLAKDSTAPVRGSPPLRSTVEQDLSDRSKRSTSTTLEKAIPEYPDSATSSKSHSMTHKRSKSVATDESNLGISLPVHVVPHGSPPPESPHSESSASNSAKRKTSIPSERFPTDKDAASSSSSANKKDKSAKPLKPEKHKKKQ